MSSYSLISLLLSALWLYLGFKAISIDRMNTSYRLFAVLCATMFVWTLFLGAVYSAKSAEHVELLLKIAYIGGFLFSPVNLHFLAEISGLKLKPYLLVLSYGPSVALLVSNLVDFFVFTRFEKRANERYGIIDATSIRVHLYVFVVCLTFVVSSAVILRWHRRARLNKERLQSRLMLVIFSSTYLTSLVGTLILPLFGIHDLQPIGITLFAAYIVGLYVLISRFRFLGFTRSIPSEELIANISDFVFLLDTELRIKEMSGSVGMLFHNAAEKLRDRPICEITSHGEEIAVMARKILEGTAASFSTITVLRTESATFPAKTYFAAMKDKFRDVSGFLMVAREVKDISRFQELYKITGRELQVTGLVVSGFTYREVAEKLGITEKTVERHMTNIFNKVNVNNKVELFRLTSEYNLAG